MLIKKLIKSTLGIKDHRVVSVTGDTHQIIIHLDHIKGRRRTCSCCGKRQKVRDRLSRRKWCHAPLWNIPVFIHYCPARVKCHTCGIKVESIPWSNGKSKITIPFSLSMATWARKLPMDVVSKMYGVCWNSVYSAVKQAVAYGLKYRDMSKTIFLGIDEISRKKGHIYHTQIYDLVYRKLLASFEDRTYESLSNCLKTWSQDNLKNIRAICCDMWDPYLKAIKEFVPDATVVYDKFHLVRHLLKAVNDVRIQEAESLKESNPDLLKGTRYIWLKNPWNLTHEQKVRFSDLEKLNLKINRAYLLKESFRELWTYYDRNDAKTFLKQWFWWATHSRLEPMRKFAWMLRNHEEGILAYFDFRIDNGAVEAMNNNAKSISHRARGYRSSNTFSTLLMHCLGDLKMPDWTHKFS